MEKKGKKKAPAKSKSKAKNLKGENDYSSK